MVGGVILFWKGSIVRRLGLGRTGGILTLFVLMVVLMFGAGTVGGQVVASKGSAGFGDVLAGRGADEEVGWAVANGVSVGVGVGRFGTNGVVTGGRFVPLLDRTVNLFQDSSVTPDAGGRIVFQSYRNGSYQIFVMNADGTDVRPLTSGGYLDQAPSWSPDGARIVFSTDRGSADGTVKLFVMDADGANVRQLTTGPGDHVEASWSPDGSQIAFTSVEEGEYEGFVIDTDGANLRKLTSSIGSVPWPSWSPDGTQIAFESAYDGDYEVFVMNVDGANLRQLTNNTFVDGAPSWSPDGTQIAYVSDQDGDLELFVMNVDGANLRQLTNNTHVDRNPGWSPDGTQIAYVSDQDGDLELFVMNVDGANLRQLTDNTAVDSITNQAWSTHTPNKEFDLEGDRTGNLFQDSSVTPDAGGKILFTSDRSGSFQIYVMNADGTDQRRLTHGGDNDFSPAWSPDGTRIAFSSNRASAGFDDKLFLMDADGTNMRQLTTSSGDHVLPSWSPDGTQIAYTNDDSLDGRVIDVDFTNPRKPSRSIGSGRGLQWSPDGTQIVFGFYERGVDDDYDVWVMNADGANRRQLTHNTYNDLAPSWSPDGTQIAYSSRQDGDFEMFVMNADGTNVRQLTNNTFQDVSDGWSPDGTQILFTSHRDGDGEVYVMNTDGTNVRQLTHNTAEDYTAQQSWFAQTPQQGSDLEGGEEYSDVADAGNHRTSVELLAEKGILAGTQCAPGRFCPTEPIQRWVMAVWLVRAVDGVDPDAGSSSRFVDVDPTEWWVRYVERLADLGITRGCSTEPARFCPDQPVTRQQMASFLVRAFGLEPVAGNNFADVAEGNSHLADINALARARVTAGCAVDPARYCPTRDTTRAQMATFLARAIGLVELPTPSHEP